MYILHKASIKSDSQYHSQDQKKIECYKDVNYKLMKMMIPTQKMSLMSMHKIISVMNETTKELPLSKGTHMSV